eukprot:3941687-Rhodomonas_salina.4
MKRLSSSESTSPSLPSTSGWWILSAGTLFSHDRGTPSGCISPCHPPTPAPVSNNNNKKNCAAKQRQELSKQGFFLVLSVGLEGLECERRCNLEHVGAPDVDALAFHLVGPAVKVVEHEGQRLVLQRAARGGEKGTHARCQIASFCFSLSLSLCRLCLPVCLPSASSRPRPRPRPRPRVYNGCHVSRTQRPEPQHAKCPDAARHLNKHDSGPHLQPGASGPAPDALQWPLASHPPARPRSGTAWWSGQT